MMHVYDHFSYTNDVQWWKTQGYPLLKVRFHFAKMQNKVLTLRLQGVASFHLDKLIADEHFKDGSLVTNPCNSPEQLPITLGMPHS